MGSLKGKEWEEVLPEEGQIMWREILKGYVELPNTTIPRFCLPSNDVSSSKNFTKEFTFTNEDDELVNDYLQDDPDTVDDDSNEFSVHQVVVRSLRDISVIYSVGEMVSNTVEHFNRCNKSGSTSSQTGLGLPGTGSGLGAKDDEGKAWEIVGGVDALTDSDGEIDAGSVKGSVEFQPKIIPEESV